MRPEGLDHLDVPQAIDIEPEHAIVRGGLQIGLQVRHLGFCIVFRSIVHGGHQDVWRRIWRRSQRARGGTRGTIVFLPDHEHSPPGLC